MRHFAYESSDLTCHEVMPELPLALISSCSSRTLQELSMMFTRCLFALCFVGSIGFNTIARAQSDDNRNKQRLPNTQWYSGIGSQSGDRTTFRDSSGRTIGSANTSGNRTTVRDASGRTIETASTNRDRTTFRSSSGSNLGSASQSRNQTTFRDASGRSTGSANNNGSRTTFRDSSGRTTGSANSNRR